MEKNNKVFNIRCKNKKSQLTLQFIGKPLNENIDCDKIQKLAEACFSKIKSYENMVRNISFIRTIFKDFEEESLVLEVFLDSNNYTKIIYNNRELSNLNGVETTEEKDLFYTNYNSIDENLSFKLKPRNNDYTSVLNYPTLLDLKLKEIHNLKNVKAKDLNSEEKIICEMYKLFYGENPDFTSKDINLKIQTMIIILCQFHIHTTEDYSFSKKKEDATPNSLGLANLIGDLVPFGTVELSGEIALDSYVLRSISLIGKEIRKYSEEKNNLVQNLINLSNLIYDSKYQLSAKNIEEKMHANGINLSNEDNDCIKLVRIINEDIFN